MTQGTISVAYKLNFIDLCFDYRACVYTGLVCPVDARTQQEQSCLSFVNSISGFNLFVGVWAAYFDLIVNIPHCVVVCCVSCVHSTYKR